MREIKCKAWDIKTKKMREVHSISFHNKRDIYHYNESSTPKVINLWGYDIIEQKDIVLHRESNEVILLEHTGLKDKNGVLIYEGDIVQNFSERFIVEYWSGQILVSWYLRSINSGDTSELDCFGEYEVIGNIYENPELLGYDGDCG